MTPEERFMSEHGIREEVLRPEDGTLRYVEYGKGDVGVDKLRELPGLGRDDLRTKIEERTSQVGGVAIVRYALPDTKGPEPLAELRPGGWESVPVTYPRWHEWRYHGFRYTCDIDHVHDADDHETPCGWYHSHKGMHRAIEVKGKLVTIYGFEAGGTRKSSKRADGTTRSDENMIDRGLHVHRRSRKYLFIGAEVREVIFLKPMWVLGEVERPLIPQLGPGRVGTPLNEWENNPVIDKVQTFLGGSPFGDWDREVLEELLGQQLPQRSGKEKKRRDKSKYVTGRESRKALGTVSVDGVECYVYSEFREKAEQESMRVDMHPLAVERLNTAERIYFVLEGCIKADAVLSAIIENDERATVVSVPSVTLWGRKATYYGGDFDKIAEWGRDREVLIVVDADWKVMDESMMVNGRPRKVGNDGSVWHQAREVMNKLSILGVKHVAIGAPPLHCERHENEKDEETRNLPYKATHKGVDDWLGEGEHALGDLQVIGIKNEDAAIKAVQKVTGVETDTPVSVEMLARIIHEIESGVANPYKDYAQVTMASKYLAAQVNEKGLRHRPSGSPPKKGQKVKMVVTPRHVRNSKQYLEQLGIKVGTQWKRIRSRDTGDYIYVELTTYEVPNALLGKPDERGALRIVGIEPYVAPGLAHFIDCKRCGRLVERKRRTRRKDGRTLCPQCSADERQQRRRTKDSMRDD